MGACSSKPKTKDSDGSMEPHKATDFAADQPQHTERSVDDLADDHGKDAISKPGEEKEAAHASTEQMRAASGLDSGKEERRPNLLISGSEEGISELPSDALVKKEPVCCKGCTKADKTEGNSEGVSDEAMKIGDVAGVRAADSANENEGKEVSLTDGAKACEDKAVVSEETCGSQEDGAYVDKTVDHDEEKPSDKPGKRNIVVPCGEGMDSAACAGAESPIIGVVQPVESMNEAVVRDGAAKNVCADPDQDSTFEDKHTAVGQNADAGAGSVEVGVSKIKNTDKDLWKPGGEVFAARGGEVPPPVNSVEPATLLTKADLSKDGQDDADPLKDNQDERISQSQGMFSSDPADRVLDSTMDSNDKSAGRSADPILNDPHREERPINHLDHSHSDKPRGENSVDNPMGQASKANQHSNFDASMIESLTKDPHGGIVDGQNDAVAEGGDLGSGQMQGYGQKGNEDSRLGEKTPYEEEKNSQRPVSKPEADKQKVDRPRLEPESSGDLAFEDASDRLEPSKSIEAGQIVI